MPRSRLPIISTVMPGIASCNCARSLSTSLIKPLQQPAHCAVALLNCPVQPGVNCPLGNHRVVDAFPILPYAMNPVKGLKIVLGLPAERVENHVPRVVQSHRL